MKLNILGWITLSVFLVGCGKNPVTPTPPPPPDCQVHNTGILVLRNDAADLRPRDAIFDGFVYGPIPLIWNTLWRNCS